MGHEGIPMDGSVLHVERHYSNAVVGAIHDKVQRKILDEKVTVETE